MAPPCDASGDGKRPERPAVGAVQRLARLVVAAVADDDDDGGGDVAVVLDVTVVAAVVVVAAAVEAGVGLRATVRRRNEEPHPP